MIDGSKFVKFLANKCGCTCNGNDIERDGVHFYLKSRDGEVHPDSAAKCMKDLNIDGSLRDDAKEKFPEIAAYL